MWWASAAPVKSRRCAWRSRSRWAIPLAGGREESTENGKVCADRPPGRWKRRLATCWRRTKPSSGAARRHLRQGGVGVHEEAGLLLQRCALAQPHRSGPCLSCRSATDGLERAKNGELCWEAVLRNNDFARLKPWPCVECSQDAAPELVRRRRKRNMGEEEASRGFAQSARVLGVLPVRRRCLQKKSLSVDFC